MPIELSAAFIRSSPEYEIGFKAGYEAAKREAIQHIKDAAQQIKTMTPERISTSTYISTSNPN